MEYTLVLPFSLDGTRLLLVQKTHGPACVLGKWNGVGGKIEPDELPLDAAHREYLEETQLPLLKTDLKRLTTLRHNDATIHIFYCFTDINLMNMPSKNDVDEQFGLHFIRDNCRVVGNIVPNLLWMIPMALQGSEADLVKGQ